jgi:hypothetical protein
VGEAGTACDGIVFTITVVDPATGKVAFTPATAFSLQPPGSPGDTCRIDFTFDVLKRPTKDSQATPGIQTSQIGFASGINVVTNQPGSGIGSSSVTVLAATVGSITTSATPTAQLGSPISDTATVTGAGAPAPTPTGTVVFTAYGPDDATCAGPAVFTSAPQPLAGGPPPTANSGPFTPTAAGTYRWIAAYSGDANYDPATTLCNDANESALVAGATITTVATPTAVIGSPISDTATVTGTTGAATPTGTVTFTAYGPNDATCAGPAVFTSPARPLVPGGGPPPSATATSGPFTPATPGTYRWIASYSGDAVYPAATTLCNDANESTVVSQAAATIVTSATPTVTVGSPISDTATVTGGVTTDFSLASLQAVLTAG